MYVFESKYIEQYKLHKDKEWRKATCDKSSIENQGGSVAVALVSNTGESFLREKEARRLFGYSSTCYHSIKFNLINNIIIIMSTPIITNRNIRDFVQKYQHNKASLPSELQGIPIGEWNVSRVTDMSTLFKGFGGFNEPLDGWDVSNVIGMESMFSGCTSFNQPLNKWNVGNIINMEGMFSGCTSFNQPLNKWNVGNVTNMIEMFRNCIHFNESLDGWARKVGNVTNMGGMFFGCTNFNQPLNRWNVGNVTIMWSMFSGCTEFNQSLNEWALKVGNVTTIAEMFSGCTNFNQPLNEWDVGNVTGMGAMFFNCTNFNQPLNEWARKVGNVTDMGAMFSGCTNFNQPLDEWDVGNVANMTEMFLNCTNFNQPLNRWNVRNVTDIEDMFTGCDIQEENEPIFRDIPQVNLFQIHQASSKINYDKLNQFLEQDHSPRTIPSNYGIYINDTLLSFIAGSDESESTKDIQRSGLSRIMRERLTSLNYSEINQKTRTSIVNALEYVKLQPPEFRKVYVNIFIQDCVHAYEGEAGMTCAAGALERIIMSLVPAAQSLLSTSTSRNDEKYQRLIDIIVANPEKLIPEYIREWYKLHKTGTTYAFPPGTTKEEKQADLKEYLLSKFPEETMLIDRKISEIADNIGYDDDDFMYGGKRKRKPRVTRKRRRHRTLKKTPSRKSKPTLRSRLHPQSLPVCDSPTLGLTKKRRTLKF